MCTHIAYLYTRFINVYVFPCFLNNSALTGKELLKRLLIAALPLGINYIKQLLPMGID
jgi:hypothetical protein